MRLSLPRRTLSLFMLLIAALPAPAAGQDDEKALSRRSLELVNTALGMAVVADGEGRKLAILLLAAPAP